MMEKSIKTESESANNITDEDDDIFLELWESTDFSNFNPSDDEKNEKISKKKASAEDIIPKKATTKKVKIKIEPKFEDNNDSAKINLKIQDKNSSKQTVADASLPQKRTSRSSDEINDDDVNVQETKKQKMDEEPKNNLTCEFCNLTFSREVGGADYNMVKKWRQHVYSKHLKTKFHEKFGDVISSKICNLGECGSKSFPDSSRIIQHLYGKRHGILEQFIADKLERKNEKSEHKSNIQTIIDLTKNDTKNDEIIEDKINNQNSSEENFSKSHQEVVEINQDVEVVPLENKNILEKKSCALCGFKIFGETEKNREMNFNNHLYSEHFKQTFQDNEETKLPTHPPYICPFDSCNFKIEFPKRSKLRMHYMSEHKIMQNYYRQEINLRQNKFGFVQRDVLVNIVNKSNDEDEIQVFKKCPQCSFQANNRAVLEMHLKNIHQKNVSEKKSTENEIQNYYCDFCDESFSEPKELGNHMLLQHKNMCPDQIEKYSKNLLQSVNLIWETEAKKNWGLNDVDLEYTDVDFQTLNTYELFKQRYLSMVG